MGRLQPVHSLANELFQVGLLKLPANQCLATRGPHDEDQTRWSKRSCADFYQACNVHKFWSYVRNAWIFPRQFSRLNA
jgi:hypothetical protein